jgi:hypothetical protein
MTVIEITEKKYDKLSEHIEESLRHLGKAMSCISEIGEPYGLGYRDDESMGYREGYSHEGRSYRKDMMGSRYGMRSRYDNYGQRGDYGYKDDEDWDDEEMMGERRRRSRRTGRYM